MKKTLMTLLSLTMAFSAQAAVELSASNNQKLLSKLADGKNIQQVKNSDGKEISVSNRILVISKLAEIAQLKNNDENDGIENDYASYFFLKLTSHLPGATTQKIAQSFASLAKDSTQFLAEGTKTEVLEEAIENLKSMDGFQDVSDDEAAYAFIAVNEILE